MTTPLLSATRLSAGHAGRIVVDGVDLSVRRGETVAIVGPNASGKSTLLQTLAGAIPLAAGQLELDGRRIDALRSAERARRMAVVPQSARWDLEFSVREMVALGRAPHSGAWALESAADREAIDEALRTCELEPLARRSYAELSGGERQRVLFARALAQKAPLLLLDEPTAHLDVGHQQLIVQRTIDHARQGGAAVIVLHDLALAARMDRVLVLEKGRVVAEGSPMDALGRERLAKTWGVDAELVQGPMGPSLAVRGRAG